MIGYINNVLTRFGHPNPQNPKHSPHLHREIIYGAKQQYTTNNVDTSSPLYAAGIKWCQGVIGCLLYYAQAVNNKLLMTLIAISASQVSATENTRNEINKILNYCATYSADGITYRASNVVLEPTPMQASSANLNHAAAPEVTTSSQRMIKVPAPMDPFCPSHKS